MDLLIHIKKGRDGPDVLTCVRPDGSATWQRVHAAFPIHDLTHYAVETTLGLRNGFLGLVAQGWDIEDFGTPWPRGPLPAEAGWVECVVGVFWQEYLGREEFPLAEVNARLAAVLGSYEGVLRRELTAAEVEQIRSRLRELAERWAEVPVGGALERSFPPKTQQDRR
jgi:hypothetical protein